MQKTKKPHRVALSQRAIKLLQAMPKVDAERIFPISNMKRLFKRMGDTETVHGFRRTFKTGRRQPATLTS